MVNLTVIKKYLDNPLEQIVRISKSGFVGKRLFPTLCELYLQSLH
jgi:hypothetical protein